jgi:hypothetical protein
MPSKEFESKEFEFGTFICPKEVTKIIFLDIDGVIQPHSSQERYIHTKNDESMRAMYADLNDRFQIDYSKYDRGGVTSAYYDWLKYSITNLHEIIEKTNARIVLSSDWRYQLPFKEMYDLFRIYDLHKYYIDNTKYFKYYDEEKYLKKLIPEPHLDSYNIRVLEILDYVDRNNQISHFVAIDDMDLSNGLKKHFVHTHNDYLTSYEVPKAIEILNFVPWLRSYHKRS